MSKKVLVDGRLLSVKHTGISRYSSELIKSYNSRYGANNVVVLVNSASQFPVVNKVIVTKLRPYNILHFFLFPFFLKRIDSDIYHSAFYSGPWFLLRRRFVVATVHDLMFWRVSNFFSTNRVVNLLARWYYYTIVRLSLANADAIISVSQTTRWDVEEIFHVKSYLFPEGVNESAISDRRDQRIYPGEKKDDFFLYVGNGRPHKNLDFLINVFRRYTGGKKLVIIGNVNDKLDGDQNIVQMKYVSDEELIFFYQNCSAFVYPSVYEGFGLPILEAISNGAYVFSSDRGALKEFNFKSISFFNPYKENELLQLLNDSGSRVFNEDDYRELDKYNWQKNFSLMHQCLESVC